MADATPHDLGRCERSAIVPLFLKGCLVLEFLAGLYWATIFLFVGRSEFSDLPILLLSVAVLAAGVLIGLGFSLRRDVRRLALWTGLAPVVIVVLPILLRAFADGAPFPLRRARELPSLLLLAIPVALLLFSPRRVAACFPDAFWRSGAVPRVIAVALGVLLGANTFLWLAIAGPLALVDHLAMAKTLAKGSVIAGLLAAPIGYLGLFQRIESRHKRFHLAMLVESLLLVALLVGGYLAIATMARALSYG